MADEVHELQYPALIYQANLFEWVVAPRNDNKQRKGSTAMHQESSPH